MDKTRVLLYLEKNVKKV